MPLGLASLGGEQLTELDGMATQTVGGNEGDVKMSEE